MKEFDDLITDMGLPCDGMSLDEESLKIIVCGVRLLEIQAEKFLTQERKTEAQRKRAEEFKELVIIGLAKGKVVMERIGEASVITIDGVEGKEGSVGSWDGVFGETEVVKLNPDSFATKEELDKYFKTSEYEKPKQIVVCAANRTKTSLGDLIICGARHWDSIMRRQLRELRESEEQFPASSWDQGFIDQFGMFLTRKEAMGIVKENGQPFDLKRNGGSDKELYSEGIY